MGILAFECCMGNAPFKGKTADDMLQLVQREINFPQVRPKNQGEKKSKDSKPTRGS
jgi:hypothetical protein